MLPNSREFLFFIAILFTGFFIFSGCASTEGLQEQTLEPAPPKLSLTESSSSLPSGISPTITLSFPTPGLRINYRNRDTIFAEGSCNIKDAPVYMYDSPGMYFMGGALCDGSRWRSPWPLPIHSFLVGNRQFVAKIINPTTNVSNSAKVDISIAGSDWVNQLVTPLSTASLTQTNDSVKIFLVLQYSPSIADKQNLIAQNIANALAQLQGRNADVYVYDSESYDGGSSTSLDSVQTWTCLSATNAPINCAGLTGAYTRIIDEDFRLGSPLARLQFSSSMNSTNFSNAVNQVRTAVFNHLASRGNYEPRNSASCTIARIVTDRGPKAVISQGDNAAFLAFTADNIDPMMTTEGTPCMTHRRTQYVNALVPGSTIYVEQRTQTEVKLIPDSIQLPGGQTLQYPPKVQAISWMLNQKFSESSFVYGAFISAGNLTAACPGATASAYEVPGAAFTFIFDFPLMRQNAYLQSLCSNDYTAPIRQILNFQKDEISDTQQWPQPLQPNQFIREVFVTRPVQVGSSANSSSIGFKVPAENVSIQGRTMNFRNTLLPGRFYLQPGDGLFVTLSIE